MTKRYHYITDDDYAIAESNGIGRRTLESRVRQSGLDIDTAITRQLERKLDIPNYIYLLAEKNGIRESTLKLRIYRSKKRDFVDAATRPIQRINMTAEEEEYFEKAKSIGISKQVFMARLKAKWSLEKASNSPLMERGKYERKINES